MRAESAPESSDSKRTETLKNPVKEVAKVNRCACPSNSRSGRITADPESRILYTRSGGANLITDRSLVRQAFLCALETTTAGSAPALGAGFLELPWTRTRKLSHLQALTSEQERLRDRQAPRPF